MTETKSRRRGGTRVLVLVGTRKGAFIFESNRARKKWQMSGPHFDSWAVNHLSFDKRTGVIFAALNHGVYGPNVQQSADLGATWQMSQGPSFGKESGLDVKAMWRVEPGHPDRPGEVWAGVDPASLFKSGDGGQSWSPVDSLNSHPTRAEWNPGAGGLILHTILMHPANPERVFVAISAAGVFRTDDGGRSWTPKNRGTHACFMPEGKQWPEWGQCVHHLVMSPTNPDLLFQQNHCGVYRSEDAGESWTSIAEGLPAKFGFPIAINRHQEQTIYVVPEVSDEFRHTPGGVFGVYRSRSGGREWEGLSKGLPDRGAFLNVLREGMAADDCQPGGVYVGTSTGQLFATRDEGDSWFSLADYLPPIHSVATAVIEG